MGIANIAAQIHANMCDHPGFGYDWGERYGGPETVTWNIEGRNYTLQVGDYDCSSSVITAWQKALEGTDHQGALNGATYTGNARAVFEHSGLFYSSWEDAKRGDVYLNDVHHMAMCQDGGNDGVYGYDALSEFCINENGDVWGGERGDQTGYESYVHGFYEYWAGWDPTLHYNGGASYPQPEKVEWPLIVYPSNGFDNQKFKMEKKGDYHMIRCVANGKVLDVHAGELKGDVNLFPENGGDNQLWKLVKVDDKGMYEIESKLNKGYVLDVAGAKAVDGAELCLWPRHGGTNQRWHLMDNGDGTYTIVSNVNRKLVLDAEGGGK